MADDAPADKLRFRFSKTGDLRLLSHHDLMRCAERMLRRADVPFKTTQGFHPTPRVVFALSLPLGVAGRNEVLEVELARPLPPADVLDRLNRAAPAGLVFRSVRPVPPSASAVPRRAVYYFPLPPDRLAPARAAVDTLLAGPKVWVDKFHPRPRRVNVRPYLRGIAILPLSPRRGEGLGVRGAAAETGEKFSPHVALAPHPQPHSPAGTGQEAFLALDLWVTGQGTARADDLLKLLGLADVVDAGAVLERADLEIRDEVAPDQPDGPPDGPPETAPLTHAPAAVAGEEDDPAARATWGLSPNGPVVE